MSEIKKIFSSFKPASLSDWTEAARHELNGANPMENLTLTVGGIAIQPYYDQNDGRVLLTPSSNLFLGPRTWFNCPRLMVDHEENSNKKALDHLKQGADGILFEINGPTNFNSLCKGISWEFASVNFIYSGERSDVAQSLLAYLQQEKIDSNCLPGAFYGKSATLKHTGEFRMAGFTMNSTDNPANDIASVLKKISKEALEAGVAIRVSVNEDFFLSMAIIRALRVVWIQWLTAKGVAAYPLHVHAISASWHQVGFEPHGNMLKGTTAAMAAVLGGCDALSVEPQDDDSTLAVRAARNISNVLREEAHLSRVADPVAGAYFVDHLTDEIVVAAWALLSTKS